MGKPLDQRQRFKSNSVWSGEYQTLRAYNLSGNVATQTYPSGRTVSYSYDSAGRTNSFTGNLGGESRNYATGITYSPFGGKTREQFGTNTAVYHKLHYNVRGQLYDVRASNVNDDLGGELGALVNHYSNVWVHGGSGPDNNGNVLMSQTIVNGNFMEDRYSYDALNRLTSVAEYQNGATLTGRQTYTYDRYGNRTIDAAQTSGVGINNQQFTVNTSNNRLGIPGGQTGTMSYDNSGNLTTDTYSGSAVTRVYDAENRMTSETQPGGVVAGDYTYNADGQRVRRKVGTEETWQVYGMEGELLAEYAASGAAASPQKEYGYRNGELLVTAEAAPPSTINGYSYQRTLTTDHNKVPNTDQTNFPLLISGTHSYLATVANGGNVQNANGYDVIFTSDAGCVTKLDHEVESYSATTGAVNYWVKVPTVSHSSDTSIYMCYGNPSITTDQSNKPGVWDANYKGVWHLPNGSSLSTTDSTANGNNGTNNSASAVSGKVDGAAGFNGTSQNISVPQIVATNTTVEHWVYRTGSTFVVMVDTGWNATDGFVTVVTGAGKHTFIKQARFSVFSTTNSALNTWEHVVWTVGSDNKARLYVNGSLTYTDTDTQAIISQTHGGSIGSRLDISGNPFQYFPGNLDEVRISNIARTADWIAASYNNQSSPATFYSISSASSGSSSAEVKWLVSDHLGTPRIIADETGSLAGIKRHDYLPFGEELLAGTGGRTLAQGYSGDAVRQKFTSKERDIETGLDYFGARYYSSLNGRLTSVDPMPVTSENFVNPQRWNQYSYVLNNPLASVDPSGGDGQGKGGDKVISVFLHISADQSRDKIADKRTNVVIGNAPGPWQKVKREVGSKYKIELYGSAEMTGEAGSRSAASYYYDQALTNSEVSVYVGHGSGPGAGTDENPFRQEGIQMDSMYYQGQGKELINPDGRRSGLFLDKPVVSASIVASFSCDSRRPGGSYFNFTGKGQVMITINSGTDGVTNAPTLEKAAAAFVRVYARTGGDYVRAAAAANKVIQDNQHRKKNKGDAVETKVVN